MRTAICIVSKKIMNIFELSKQDGMPYILLLSSVCLLLIGKYYAILTHWIILIIKTLYFNLNFKISTFKITSQFSYFSKYITAIKRALGVIISMMISDASLSLLI